jgi:hypothetical protein
MINGRRETQRTWNLELVNYDENHQNLSFFCVMLDDIWMDAHFDSIGKKGCV